MESIGSKIKIRCSQPKVTEPVECRDRKQSDRFDNQSLLEDSSPADDSKKDKSFKKKLHTVLPRFKKADFLTDWGCMVSRLLSPFSSAFLLPRDLWTSDGKLNLPFLTDDDPESLQV